VGGEAASPRRARVVHTIRYRFELPAAGADLVLCVTPRPLPDQTVEQHQILVDPRTAAMTAEEDENGNLRHRVALRQSFRALEIVATSTIVRRDPGATVTPEARRAVLDLLSRCGVQSAARGACRELAELSLARLRAHGVPCRYVAGYPLPAQQGRTLPHAWVSLHLGDHGWVDFDGTRDAIAPAHLVLGWGRGYEDVAPISGTLDATGRYRLVSSVTVEPLSAALDPTP
jgi:hypothetical protein